MKTTTIAFIGLGAMGTPMAANLIAAGFSVRAWSRNPAKAAALKGATACPSPREATEGSNVLITMLSDEAAVESVLVGANGALAGLAPGMIHIGMSTVSLAATRKFADMHTRSGVRYVAAPVFGRPDAAQARLLYIVAGGDLRGVERSAPIFSVLGQETYLHETAEQAMVVKLVGNYLIGATVQALGEALALGEKGGVNVEEMFSMLNLTLFGSPIFKNYGTRILRAEFTPPGFTVALARKDFRLIQEAAADKKVPMPLAELVAGRLNEAIKQGKGDHDFAGLAALVREGAGLKEKRERRA